MVVTALPHPKTTFICSRRSEITYFRYNFAFNVPVSRGTLNWISHSGLDIHWTWTPNTCSVRVRFRFGPISEPNLPTTILIPTYSEFIVASEATFGYCGRVWRKFLRKSTKWWGYLSLSCGQLFILRATCLYLGGDNYIYLAGPRFPHKLNVFFFVFFWSVWDNSSQKHSKLICLVADSWSVWDNET
jgi:hypothetical protein